jgi:hypothetical protein
VNVSRRKLYGKFKKGKTLTTQVVRRTDFKREERLHQGFHYSEGQGKKIRRTRYNHQYEAKFLINKKKSPSSPLFFFFYTISHSFMLESLNWAQG